MKTSENNMISRIGLMRPISAVLSHTPILPYSVTPILLAILLYAPCALADPVYDYPETWNSGQQGWNKDTVMNNPYTTIVNPGTGGAGGAGDGFLRLTFAELGEPAPGEDYDYMKTVSTPATTYFIGDYSSIAGIKFDFFADTVLPADLEVRFGVEGNSHVWASNLDTANIPIGDWTTLYAPLSFGSFLDGPGTGQAEFLADIETVAWIGIYIRRDGLDQQVYGLDNFMLYIPEPGEVMILMTALLGLATSFRKRIGQAITALQGSRFSRA